MERYFTIGCVAALAVTVLCFLGNLVVTSRRGQPMQGLTRGVYLSGAVAAALNMGRVWFGYQDSRGTMMAANVVALVCILVAYRRAMQPQEPDEEEEPEQK